MSMPDVPDRPFVLSAGTTEPWAAAGIHLDIFLAERLSIRPVTCILAVTAQDGGGNFSICAVERKMVNAQLQALTNAPISAMRIGALHTEDHVDVLAAYIQEHLIPVVLDPVIATSAGNRFVDEAVMNAMQRRLFPYVTLLTPNLTEAEAFSQTEIRNVDDMEEAARRIAGNRACSVLIKGGHLLGDPVDVLWDGTIIHRLTASRVQQEMRGTGCTLAIACTAALAHGKSLMEAVHAGRETVRTYLRTARKLGAMHIAR